MLQTMPDFPPTVLVHGTVDADVPYAESARIAARLGEVGVKHHFISLAGIGHGFAGARPEEAEATDVEIAECLRAHLQ